MRAFSRKDELFASLAVVVLLIGTATGSGIAMFVISAIALALMVVLTPRAQLRRGLLIALVGAVIGIGVLLAFFEIVPVDLLR
jgi:4-hydroxybenzoate polyprenyltransferase